MAADGSGSEAVPGQGREPWQAFAEVLLHREAATARLGRGSPPHDFAGLYIPDSEIDNILRELPGLDGPGPAESAGVRRLYEELIDSARVAFRSSLCHGDSRFAVTCANAGAPVEHAEVLALLAAVELDVALQRLVAYIQDNVTLPRPTLGLLRRLFLPAHDGALAVAEDSPLKRAAIVDVQTDGPWAVRMVETAPSMIWTMVGDRSFDTQLPERVRVVVPDRCDLGGAALLLTVGGDATTRLGLALSAAAGTAFLVSSMPRHTGEWRALIREATISGLTVVIEMDQRDEPADARRWIEQGSHLNWVLSSRREVALESLPRRPWRELRADDGEATDEDWSALGLERPDGHRLDREQLRLVAAALPATGDLDAAVRRLAGGHLDGLAVRIRPSRSWDDLVLPPDQIAQLRELTTRYRWRDTVYHDWGFGAIPSSGLIALFAGESGTGKTLTAEVIADDLGLDVYKIDLSSVVSKYIGETEKNLERIFVAAGNGSMVLFFDEADSLFGKRSEVSDAHDRYANIEVSYLLQRLESYEGLTILATNFKKNIDEAFLRRIHVFVDFAVPDEEQRRRIWEISFPDKAPLDDLDYGFLARQFKVSGGTIRNAALYSAFLAADAGTAITMVCVAIGLKREFQKLGRLRTEEDFEQYFHVVRSSE